MEIKKYLNEVWKPIRGYVGLYEVSNYGRVKSLDRTFIGSGGSIHHIAELFKKQTPLKNGYLHVILCKDGKKKTFLTHRLVAQTFLPNPNNLPCINHKDVNPANNYIHINEDGSVDPDKSNLEWCTYSYNNTYADRSKKASVIIAIPVLQFSTSMVFINEWSSAREAERQTGVLNQSICKCCLGKLKSAGGFIWKYKDAS